MSSTRVGHKIDELGRITLPIEIREKAGLKPGDSVLLFYDYQARSMVLRLYEKYAESKCELCGKHKIN